METKQELLVFWKLGTSLAGAIVIGREWWGFLMNAAYVL